MVVLLDTGSLPWADRVAAVDAALSDREIPAIQRFAPYRGELWHRLTVWDLGQGVHATRVDGTGMRVTRGPKQVRAAAPERVGLGLQLRAPATFAHCGVEHVVGVGDLELTDGTSASDYEWRGIGGTKVVILDYALLGLPIDTVRSAATRLRASPLYGLVAAHIAALGEEGEIPAGPARIMVESATIQLVRALITTAADTRGQHDDLRESLAVRLTAYVERRLGDSALTPGQIAAAHHISVRQLYNVWSAAHGLPIGEWIMTTRLEGARAELARGGRAVPIGQVAVRWGFVNPAHFSRRFRAAFGMSPRAWQWAHSETGSTAG